MSYFKDIKQIGTDPNGELKDVAVGFGGVLFSAKAGHRRIIVSKEWQACECHDDLADTSSRVYHIKVGANSTHGTFTYWSEGKIKIEFYEAPTKSADGTEITIRSINRETVTTPTTTVFHTPTTSANGTKLCELKLGQAASGGFFGASASGGNREGGYWMLKPNTSYLIIITNQSGEASDICMNYEFHEHTAV